MFWLQKFDDGTMTVLEFFKLFNIDFVIHNPRQSVLPGRVSSSSLRLRKCVINNSQVQWCDFLFCFLQLLSDTDRTPMDLLKDRHVNRPKQMVYETNVLSLTEKVEGYVCLRLYNTFMTKIKSLHVVVYHI